MSAAASIVAAQAASRRKLLSHFRSNGALSPERAIAMDSLPRLQFHPLERLQTIGAVRSTADGKLYLDEQRLQEVGQQQQRAAAIALAVLVAFLLIVFLVFFAVHAFAAH